MPQLPFQLPKFCRSLSAKFLICLVPVFLIVAGVGFVILSQYDDRRDSDALAARIGTQAARVAQSLAHHNAHHNTMMAADLISYLAADRAVQCAEFRDISTNRLVVALPGRIGCRNVEASNRLVLPVGNDNAASLVVVFSDAEVIAAANTRRVQQALLVSAAFIISLIAALAGFSLIVARPLARLHTAIRRISDTGERLPVVASQGDELSDIIAAFNEMIERETEREGILEQANVEIRELNHSLEDRVQMRTDQLLQKERGLRALIENFSSGIYIHNEFKPLYANQTLLDMFGFRGLDDFLSIRSTEVLLAPEERDRIWGYHKARLEGGSAPKDYDFEALRQNGEKFMANNRSFVVDWEGQSAVCTTLFDLTARQKTERSLAEQKHLMDSLLATTQEGFWFIDLEKRTTDANPAMCRILGRPREEIIGKSIMEFVDDKNAEIFRDQIARRFEGQTGAYEISLQRPDGSLVPCLNNATPLLTADGTQIGSVGIWADISEIKMTQRSLEHEKERAQSANVAKSEFLAIASHELRTPMNGVLGMADLMMGSDLSVEQRERLEIIIQSGKALLGLLNDILDISKIEAGGFEFEHLHFDLTKLLDEVGALMGSRAEQLGLIYGNKIDPNVPRVLVGDVKRIRQILINIVGNAVKFTKSGQIKISVSQIETDSTHSLLRFDVTDTGIGIDEQAQDRIFDKFTQADSSTTRQFGGTGLGLAICKELAELMDGQIGVTSTIGEGSCFWFTLKLGIGDPREITVDENLSTSVEPTSLERKLRILVAEDNSVNQEIARQTLEDAGHDVSIAANGLEAVAAVQEGLYDIILMDVHMPVMDGPTATRRIRDLPGPVSEIPIIALTADAMAGDREKFLSDGMNDYVSKPFDTNHLFTTIARHIRDSDSSIRSKHSPEPAQNEADSFHNVVPTDSGLDPAIISTIRDNKPDLWKRLVELYLTNTPEYLDTLENAFLTGDRAAVRMAAHTMKSSSANLGAMKLSALCEELECEADIGELSTGHPQLSIIRHEFSVVSAELEKSSKEGASYE